MADIELIIEKTIENWENEVRRGVVVLIVLAALVDEDLHGMALMDKIERKTGGSEILKVPLGTIYPLVRRFNENGMIETYKHPVDGRKTMYKLNRYGKIFFIRARELWLRYSAATHSFIDSVDETNLRGV